MSKRKKIRCNEDICMGCSICAVACSLAHTPDIDNQFLISKNYKLESRNVVACRNAKSFMNSCKNCKEAPCIKACVSGAITRNKNENTVINAEKCIACWTCIMVCPNGAIRMRDTGDGKKYSVKCDLCENSDIPACVKACPNQALSVVEE